MPKGAAALGIAWSDVDDKYRTLVPSAGLSTGTIEASLELIHGFRQVSNVSALTKLLLVDAA